MKIDKKRILGQAQIVCMIIGAVALFSLINAWNTKSMLHIIMLIAVVLLMILGYRKVTKELRRLLDEDTADMARHDENVRHYMELLKPSGRDAIRISFADNGKTPLPAGCSKYGGRPDVPANFQWPHDSSGRPLSLLLQIDCADLASLDHEGLLPTSGQLYFFYELSQMDRDGKENDVQVIYNDLPSSQLNRLEYPVNLDKKYQLQECRLQFSQFMSVPTHSTIEPLNEEDEDARLEAIILLWDESHTDIGSMLGYPYLIQGPIVDDLSDDVLLLQLYSTNNKYGQKDDKFPHDLLFGDYGIIYFYIKREDLLARHFDNIKFAMQSN